MSLDYGEFFWWLGCEIGQDGLTDNLAGLSVLAPSFRHFRSISIGTSSDNLRLKLAQSSDTDHRWSTIVRGRIAPHRRLIRPWSLPSEYRSRSNLRYGWTPRRKSTLFDDCCQFPWFIEVRQGRQTRTLVSECADW